MEKLQTLVDKLIMCNNENERVELISKIKNETSDKIFHGSTVTNLSTIEAKPSTQKGEFVYGTPNFLYAVIFSIIQRTNFPFPPKFGWNDKEIFLAERNPKQFESIFGISSSIYRLNKENFSDFSDHSEGKNIEMRAVGNQEVLEKIKIQDPLKLITQFGVKLYSYEERTKVGIPLDDKYMVQGVLKTYSWKIEDGSEEGYLQGRQQIEYIKKLGENTMI